MPKSDYTAFFALDPFFNVVMEGLSKFVDGEHYFDTVADALAVHPSGDGRVVTLEYEVHGRILKSGVAYSNRFVSIAFIESRKIVHWRDYMDSLAAWKALTSAT